MNIEVVNKQTFLEFLQHTEKKSGHREIIKKRAHGDTLSKISKEIGTTKQWVEYLYNRFIDSLLSTCDRQCIKETLFNSAEHGSGIENVIRSIAKREMRKRGLSDISKKELQSAILSVVHESGEACAGDIAKKLGIDLESALILLNKNGFFLKNGCVLNAPEKPKKVYKVVMEILRENREGMNVEEIREKLIEKTGKDIAPNHIVAIFSYKGIEDEVCNDGRMHYRLCKYVLEDIGEKKIQEMASAVESFVLKDPEKYCIADVRFIKDKMPELFKDMSYYMVKNILVLSGKFEKVGKIKVRLKHKACEQVKNRKLKDLIEEILSDGKPRTVSKIIRELEKRYARKVIEGEISYILSDTKNFVYTKDGYTLVKFIKNVDPNWREAIKGIATALFEEYPRGYFIEVLENRVKEILGIDIDKFWLKNFLKENGFNVFGRKTFLIVLPSDYGKNPMLDYVGKFSDKEAAEKFMKDFGGIYSNVSFADALARIRTIKYSKNFRK